MSKRKGTTENRLRPGDPRNLDVAIWGEVEGPEYKRHRALISEWAFVPGIMELIEKKPFPKDVPKYRRSLESLKSKTANFIGEAILKNNPEDILKLARALESHCLGVKSPDVYAALLYVWGKRRLDSDYKFTLQEFKNVVASAKKLNQLDVKSNEALDKRAKRIAQKIGIKLHSGQ
jgi:hypothetical protein